MKRDYLSYSALKAFAKSPNHYLQYVQREFQETNAMKRSLDKEQILHSLTNCMAMLQVAHDHLQAMSK